MITIAVLYNVFFVIARSVFWDMTHNLWMIFDYIADVIYLMDLFVRLCLYLNLYFSVFASVFDYIEDVIYLMDLFDRFSKRLLE